MSDYNITNYLQLNTTCPDMVLWEQYKKNQVLQNYFNWVSECFQTTYFNYINNNIKELGAFQSTTEYLEYFSLYWYGIIRPKDITSSSLYDIGLQYDNGVLYDTLNLAGSIEIGAFRRFLLVILNRTYGNWNTVTYYRMTADFCQIPITDVIVTYDEVNLHAINISVPNNKTSLLFKSLLDNYYETWNFPVGKQVTITLR